MPSKLRPDGFGQPLIGLRQRRGHSRSDPRRLFPRLRGRRWARSLVGKVRAPDVAFVSREWAVDLDDESGFVTVIPDLVGEIVSSRAAFSDVEQEVLAWLAAGVRLVLVIDPATKTLLAYRSPEQVTVLRVEEPASTRICDASDVVPGFTFAVAELFA